MLLVCGEDQVVEHFAAGDGGVVAQERVDQPRPVLQGAVVAHHEPHRLDAVEDVAARARYPVDQLHPLPDLRGRLLGGIDREVLELVGALDVRAGPDLDVLDDAAALDDAPIAHRPVEAPPGVELLLRDLAQPLGQLGIVRVRSPESGVGGDHSVEGHYAATARLVDQVQRDADLLVLALLHYPVTELGVVGGEHLVDVQQHRVVADYVVGEVSDVVDRHVVPDVAGDDPAVGDPHRDGEFVMGEAEVVQAPDPDQPVELAVRDKPGVELLGDKDVVPVVGGVSVLNQPLNLVRAQLPPRVERARGLLVPQVVLVGAGGEERVVDEMMPQRFGLHDLQVTHCASFPGEAGRRQARKPVPY